ncbi:DUF1289 domain-containing protein [Sapientia aquatica]|uniref:DUF1289 domain-containing protein n=1 Tax=Sapientia aquatica TaxID=1549640 RepID=A0A4R5W2Y6_9BURK|nr:DUF1289 domain-containing protein [Sapientia aquatica]TDK66654.1 DUF1289 domain-containing protein [Sapientia aquatica]
MIVNKSATLPDVASPCINICKMNERSGLCEGCWRTLDEIIVWGKSDNANKRAILQQIELRKHAQFDGDLH